MKRLLLALAAVAFTCPAATAENAANQPPATSHQPPIRALLVTGGCCHDYDRQKLIIPRGVSARAHVVWTVVQQGGSTTDTKIPLYEDPNWADNFDIVVHNECFAGVKDRAWVECILKPHREGLPAVVIHCAMHCYRTGTDDWFKFCGVQSPGHGAHYAYTVENLAPDNPIMKGFGDTWTVPAGELYHIKKLMPTARPLAQAKRRPDNKPQVCIWTNQYGKGRVFGTTIGHYNATMAEPVYLDMLTRGILWATGRLDKANVRQTSEETDQAIKKLVKAPTGPKAPIAAKCCVEGNLAHGKSVKASSEETGKHNFAKYAVDGDLATRWCANGSKPGEWWQVDLEKPQRIRSLRIHWEKPDVAYRYKVESSADGQEWRTIVDLSKNDKKGQIAGHTVDAPLTRYLRVTFLGSSTGVWGSFWEFEAYADKNLPPLPQDVQAGGVGTVNVVTDVKAPEGFNVTLFGKPPVVNYPVCLTAAPTGEVFIGVDDQGSLGKTEGRGKVLRCVDVDGDGRADRVNVFAKMDHPRGLIYDDGTLWVLHPPTLSVYYDDDRDGKADRHQVLIDGISTAQVAKRGADHTTNGIRMGIDGWIYIAVGDYGFTKAVGADGITLSRRGGGIVRIRPDGGEMEIYCWGLRNILDVSIDPYLNMFTRGNTNDGGGWNVRLMHIFQTANYGYPSLFVNFTEETMPTLADLGGGSGCGTMYLHDLRWPAPYGDAWYTCDWGRSFVYRHNLPAVGPTFEAHQEPFVKIPRPTDIDVDGGGRMYVSSWKDGKFSYSGPNVGFVAQITPAGFTPKPFPYLDRASDAELVAYLSSPSAVYRLHGQREILRRGRSPQRSRSLLAVARDDNAPLYGRVAAIFTLKQLDGAAANPALVELTKNDAVREWALRALTDRKTQLAGVPLEPFLAALNDSNPRVRAQALISLGRLGKTEAAEAILPLTARPSGSELPTKEPLYAQPDPDRVLPHLAVQALAALDATEACLEALNGPYRDGALWTLRYLHNDRAVEGLIAELNKTDDAALRRGLATTLIRLYYREGDYKSGWWGTRPDTSGPYYNRATWSESSTIAAATRDLYASADAGLRRHIEQQLARHHVKLEGLTAAPKSGPRAEMTGPIELPKVDPNNKNQIANMPFEQAAARALKTPGNPERGKLLFTAQSCVACHTVAEGQTPKGPHLVDIGKRYKPAELVESILKPSAKIAQGFDTYSFITTDGKILQGFVVSESAEAIELRQNDGTAKTLPTDEIDERVKQEVSMMPNGVVGNLTPEQLADLLAYLESLRSGK